MNQHVQASKHNVPLPGSGAARASVIRQRAPWRRLTVTGTSLARFHASADGLRRSSDFASLSERDKDANNLTPRRRGLNCGIAVRPYGPSADQNGHISPIRKAIEGEDRGDITCRPRAKES